jgi:hypothetical protein
MDLRLVEQRLSTANEFRAIELDHIVPQRKGGCVVVYTVLQQQRVALVDQSDNVRMDMATTI